MNLLDWARFELERLTNGVGENDEMQKVMNENILELLGVFSKQGHTGFSANYLIPILSRLMSYKPITPLTGEDDEWDDVSAWWDAKSVQQNKRFSAVFRENNDNSTAYWVDGRVFSDDGGKTWFIKGGGASSVRVCFPWMVPDKPEHIILKNGKCQCEYQGVNQNN
jgi:hypothetical protein